ncbi:hypothetical protein K438DRAFT_1775552 [Mycena galopus ATCC 62051]|nr:hypothetical protein K438DRAFT_1775552 [Mycena galopus ATCC 62051]
MPPKFTPTPETSQSALVQATFASQKVNSRTIWRQILHTSPNELPRTWTQASITVVNYHRSELYTAHPLLRFCEHHWKVNLLATTGYPSWYKKNVKNAGKSTSRVKRTPDSDDSPSDDDDDPDDHFDIDDVDEQDLGLDKEHNSSPPASALPEEEFHAFDTGQESQDNGYNTFLDNANTFLADAVLDGAFLTDAVFNNTFLAYAVLGGAFLDNTVLDNAFLVDAVLDNAFLADTFLDNAFLDNAFLDNAFLDNVNAFLADVVLDNAFLDDAVLVVFLVFGADAISPAQPIGQALTLASRPDPAILSTDSRPSPNAAENTNSNADNTPPQPSPLENTDANVGGSGTAHTAAKPLIFVNPLEAAFGPASGPTARSEAAAATLKKNATKPTTQKPQGKKKIQKSNSPANLFYTEYLKTHDSVTPKEFETIWTGLSEEARTGLFISLLALLNLKNTMQEWKNRSKELNTAKKASSAQAAAAAAAISQTGFWTHLSPVFLDNTICMHWTEHLLDASVSKAKARDKRSAMGRRWPRRGGVGRCSVAVGYGCAGGAVVVGGGAAQRSGTGALAARVLRVAGERGNWALNGSWFIRARSSPETICEPDMPRQKRLYLACSGSIWLAGVFTGADPGS